MDDWKRLAPAREVHRRRHGRVGGGGGGGAEMSAVAAARRRWQRRWPAVAGGGGGGGGGATASGGSGGEWKFMIGSRAGSQHGQGDVYNAPKLASFYMFTRAYSSEACAGIAVSIKLQAPPSAQPPPPPAPPRAPRVAPPLAGSTTLACYSAALAFYEASL